MQLTYYVAPWDRGESDEPGWTPAPDDVHTLRYGYNLADLEKATRLALWRVVGGHLDYRTRYDLAWSAITEALYSAAEPPTPADLVAAGQAAIARHVRIDMRHRGVQFGGRTGPRFATYWMGLSSRTPSPEDRVVDAVALWQIWPHLTNRQREALLALAAHEDYRAAAAALGVAPGTYKVLIGTARRRFLALWHEGEAPSRPWGAYRRAPRTARSATRTVGRHKERPAHELVHGSASTYRNHGCRCTPCTQASAREADRERRARGVPARRRVTVSQLADIRRRQAAGETLTAIAVDVGFSDGYLSRLVRGLSTPAPDPEAT